MAGNDRMTAKIVGLDEYKGYKIVSGFGSMVEVKALGKGKVSNTLTGSYTSQTEARKAIDHFVSENNGSKTNGANKTTS